MSDYNIKIKLDPTEAERNAKKVEKAVDRVGTTADKVGDLVQKAFLFAGIGVGIKEIFDIADAYTVMQNKLKNVVTSTDQLNVVTQALFDISNQTRSSIESTVELYSRVGLAVKDLGKSQSDVLSFTKSLNQAVALSGASSAEASAGIVQLAQGMAAGVLRGDELNSVLEQLPMVADVISKSMGITRGELRSMGAEGKITADIIFDAFKKSEGVLNEQFAKTVPTLSNAWTVFRNKFTQALGELNTSTGVLGSISTGVIYLADNLETLGRVAGAVAIVITVNLVQKGILYAIDAIKALNIVMMSNPWTALATVLLSIVALLVTFSDKITLGSDKIVTLRDYAIAAFQLIKEAVGPVITAIGTGLSNAIDYVSSVFSGFGITFSEILGVIKTGVNLWIALYVGFASASEVIFTKVKALVLDALGSETAQKILLAFRAVFVFITDSFRTVAGWAGTLLKAVGVSFEMFADTVKDKFGDVWESIKPDMSVPSGMKSFGVEVKDAFLNGFGNDYIGKAIGSVGNAVDHLHTRAKSIADKRAADAAAQKAKDEAARATLSQAGENRVSTVDKAFEEYIKNIEKEGELLKQNESDRVIDQELLKAEKSLKRDLTQVEENRLRTQLLSNKALSDKLTIDKTVDQLTKEAELLRMTESERAVANEQLKLEDELKRKLTATEVERVASAVKSNESLSNQANILSSIRGPVEEYTRAQRGLQELLQRGAISIAEYNSALSGTDLQSKLDNMRAGVGQDKDYNTDVLNLQRSHQEQLDLIKQFQDAQLISEKEAKSLLYQVNKEYSDNLVALDQQRMSAQLQLGQDLFGSLATISAGFAGKQSGIYKAMFALSKAFAIADATVKISQGIAAAAANPWPANLAAMASVAAATASILTTIQSVQFSGYQTGGQFKVGGSGGADSQLVAFRATPNETVTVRTPAQQEASQGSRQGDGGGGRNPEDGLKILNILDPSVVQDFLTSSSGEKVLLNVLHRNKGQVKSMVS